MQHVGCILGALLGGQIATAIATKIIAAKINDCLDRLVGHTDIVRGTASQLATQWHQTPLRQHGQIDILKRDLGQQILRSQIELRETVWREQIHVDTSGNQLGGPRIHGDLGAGISSCRSIGRQPIRKLGDRRRRSRGVCGPVENVLLPGDVGSNYVLDVVLIASLVCGLGKKISAGHDNFDQVPVRQGTIVAIKPDKAAGIHIIAAIDR